MAVEEPVVIIGAGLMGAASAWSLARRGRRVVVLEQFAPGHRFGSSHGSARIMRRAYGDALYTQLTGQAFELWREVEAQSGAALLRMSGGLDFGPHREVPTVAGHLRAARVPHEVLPAAEAMARWPGMRFEGHVLFHPQAGTLDSGSAVSTLLALAEREGALVRHGVAAVTVAPHGDGVQIVCSDDTSLAASAVVVAAGAWLGPLLDGVVALPTLTVTQQQVFHFPRVDLQAEPWPSTIHEDAVAMYHLAGGRDGGAADDRKLGRHDGGAVATAATRDGVVDDAARRAAIAYVRAWLPGLDPTPRAEATCLYTETATEDFLLDRVGPVVICSPCSGHGAKFAPLVGEWMADLVAGAMPVPERFRLAGHAIARSAAVSL